jgi:hypothetical protein
VTENTSGLNSCKSKHLKQVNGGDRQELSKEHL